MNFLRSLIMLFQRNPRPDVRVYISPKARAYIKNLKKKRG